VARQRQSCSNSPINFAAKHVMATASGWFGTDGEEAVKTWTDTDSLYGTRHLAEKWEKDGTLKKIKALMSWI